MKAYVIYKTIYCEASTFYDFKHSLPTEDEMLALVNELRKENGVSDIIITGIMPLYEETDSDGVKTCNSYATAGNLLHPENGVHLTLYNEDDEGNTSDDVLISLSQDQARNLAKSLLYYAGGGDPSVKTINLNDMVKVKLTEYGKKYIPHIVVIIEHQ